MSSNKTFADKWREFEAAVSSAPSVADDVMRHIEEKPIPARRREWSRSLAAMAACAVAIVCVLGVTIAVWAVIGARDRDTVALNSANDHLPRPIEKDASSSHPHTVPHRNGEPRSDQTQDVGSSPKVFTPMTPDPSRSQTWC